MKFSRSNAESLPGERLARQLAPQRTHMLRAALKILWLSVIMPGLFLGMSCYGLCTHSITIVGVLPLFAGAGLFLAIGIPAAPVMFRQAKDEFDTRQQKLSGFTREQLAALEQEIGQAVCYFGTFYLLHDYLCAPAAGLLIGYAEFSEIRVFPLRYEPKVTVIRQDGSVAQYVKVKRYRAFCRDYAHFSEMLQDRKKAYLMQKGADADAG